MSTTQESLLVVSGVSKRFAGRGGAVHAVDDVSFSINRGESVGLVGESGSGKTTLARMLVGLVRPSSGAIRLEGRAQMVFQDPFASLNPRMRVGDAIAEAIVIHKLASGVAVQSRVSELLGQVGLNTGHADRFPHEFSGGQRQRIGIARALAVKPDLLVADEPVSALDVSIQAQIVNLLQDLQLELGLAILFVAHDLSVVEHISDRVIVMRRGRIVEAGLTRKVFEAPSEPYTQALLDAVPRLDRIKR